MNGRALLFTIFLSYVCYLRDVETFIQDGEKQISNIKKLKDKLFKDYDGATRPVIHHSNETQVDFRLAPLYIIDLDEDKSMFTLDSWFILHWVDDRLSWDPSDYDGLESLSVPSYSVWQPDVIVYNAHSGDVDPKRKGTHLYILNKGDVWWVPPAKVSTYCAVNLDSTYPRDIHHCNVNIGSWTHHGSEINLTLYSDTMYMGDFLNTNPKWELLEGNITREMLKFECCTERYLTIISSFTLKRRYPAHLAVVWVPCIMIMILTLAIFWVPSDSGKKLALGGTSLIILTILFVYVAAASKAPQEPNFSVSFIRTTLIAVSSAVFLEVIVLNLSCITGPQKPPEVVVGYLSGPIGKYIGVWATWCDSIPADRIQLKEDVEQTDNRHSIRDEWLLVASAIDRFLFVVFAVVFAAIHQA